MSAEIPEFEEFLSEDSFDPSDEDVAAEEPSSVSLVDEREEETPSPLDAVSEGEEEIAVHDAEAMLVEDIDLNDVAWSVDELSSNEEEHSAADDAALLDSESVDSDSGFIPVELTFEHLPPPVDGLPWSDPDLLG